MTHRYLDRQVPVDGKTGWFWLDTLAQMHQLELSDDAAVPGQEGRLLGGEANMWSEQVLTNSIPDVV